jgi:hypothetical protein
MKQDDFVTKAAKASPRETMGNVGASGVKNMSSEGVKKGKLIKKKGAQAADPYVQKKGKRSNVKASGKPSYGGIRTKMPSYKDPAISGVQANGRIFASAMRRTKPNFDDGMMSLD